MTRFGKRFPGLSGLCLLLLLVPTLTRAALEAEIDRREIVLGDSLRLVIRSDGDANPSRIDLAGLERDFEILRRSSNTSTSIIGGRSTRSRELVLDLLARRSGELRVPAFSVDGEKTEPFAVTVTEASVAGPEDELAVLEVETDRDTAYVQQQLLLTLRILQSVNLEDRSITELKIDNAYVLPLGQDSFQRQLDGRTWLVNEIRYAIFPEQSGTLSIPEQVFSGNISRGRRSLFDPSPPGRHVRRRSKPLEIEVRSPPAGITGAAWLPARDLIIEERWSEDPGDLRTGDSLTRTITLRADGLLGSQLPPVQKLSLPGLKLYPDKPEISDETTDAGVVGIRVDSTAVVPVEPGRYTLPAIEIPWWDVAADEPRVATLPARTLDVRAAPAAGSGGSTSPAADPVVAAPATGGSGSDTALPWPWISAGLAAGWLCTAILAWLARRRETPAATGAPRTSDTEAEAFRTLRRACGANDPGAAEMALRRWLDALYGTSRPLPGHLAQCPVPDLVAASEALARARYRAGEGASAWRGDSLLAAAQRLRQGQRSAARRRPGVLAALYPAES